MKEGTMNKSYFSTWTAINLSKADEENTDEKLGFVSGIVSTENEDQAGEIIKQDGIDWSYFEEKGFFNWEHESGPENIMGYPTKVIKGEQQTSVEGYLLLDRPKAREAYDTAKVLKDVKAPRSIGFSIEGQVLERDAQNENIITKAKILNVSITAHPCNPDAKLMTKALEQMEKFMKRKAPINKAIDDQEDDQKKTVEQAGMTMTEEEKKAYTKKAEESEGKDDDTTAKTDDQEAEADNQEAKKVEDEETAKAVSEDPAMSKSEDDQDDMNKAEDDEEDDEEYDEDDDSLDDDSSLTDDFWNDADRKYVAEAFSTLFSALSAMQDQLYVQIKAKRFAKLQAQKSVGGTAPVSSRDLFDRIKKHFPTMEDDQAKQLTRKSAEIIREFFVKD